MFQDKNFRLCCGVEEAGMVEARLEAAAHADLCQVGLGFHTWDGGWSRRNFLPVVMVWSGRREVDLHVHNTD